MFSAKPRHLAYLSSVILTIITPLSVLLAASDHMETTCDVPSNYATIQAAVNDASCEIINLEAVTFHEQVTIPRPLTLQGQGVGLTIVDGEYNNSFIFEVKDAGKVTLTGMTIQNLQTSYGGGIMNTGTLTMTNCALSANSSYMGGGIMNSGTATVIDSTLLDNRALFSHGAFGGGILNLGTMTVTNSLLKDNSTTYGWYGGGIYNEGRLAVTNSTLSGNTTEMGGYGGGIYNKGILTVVNTTLTSNIAGGGIYGGSGGGIYNDSGTVRITNSIIAHNNPNDCYGIVTTLGHNIDSDGSCSLGPDDLPGTNPQLGPLQDNGGPTLTHALSRGSLAIDSGSKNCPDTDQRGVARPQDGDGDGTALCDIGAFELTRKFLMLLPIIHE